MAEVMLTTVDNPFNPFTQYDEWEVWDTNHKYYSNQYLARIARTSDELSDADNELVIEEAIDEICKLNIYGVHRKIYKEE